MSPNMPLGIARRFIYARPRGATYMIIRIREKGEEEREREREKSRRNEDAGRAIDCSLTRFTAHDGTARDGAGKVGNVGRLLRPCG